MGKSRIFIKAGIDSIFSTLLSVIYFCDVFTCYKYLKVRLTEIKSEIPFWVLGSSLMSKKECEAYNIFGFSFCDDAEKWIRAGIIFLVLGSIALVLAVLCIFSVTKLKIKFLRSENIHFLYPLIYSLAFGGYIYFSDIYNLPDSYFGEDYSMKADTGLVLMYICEVIAILSLIFKFVLHFCCVSSLTEPLIA